MSDSTASLVADGLAPDVAFVDLGVHRVHESLRPQRVWQLASADLEFEFAGLRGPDEARHNVPPATTPLVGRVGELAELHDLVGRERSLTVTGAGGVGKTRLAQRVATDLVPAFSDGVWWVDLAPVTDPTRAVLVLASAAGVNEVVGVPVEELLVRRFAEAHVLVVFDNCEHLIGAVAELAQRLVDECAHVHVLATSREPLGVRGEVTWRTPSLSVPDGDLVDAGHLESFDATRLFVERAQRARANFSVTDESAPAIVRLCRRLDGIPLAIELAAARVRVLPVERLAVELDQRFRVLTGGASRHDELWAEGTAMSLHGAIDHVLRGRGRRGRPASGWPRLTPTETIVVELVAEGLTNPQIAQRMLVDLSTVRSHVHHIFTKLGVTSRAELASAAVRRSRQPDEAG